MQSCCLYISLRGFYNTVREILAIFFVLCLREKILCREQIISF